MAATAEVDQAWESSSFDLDGIDLEDILTNIIVPDCEEDSKYTDSMLDVGISSNEYDGDRAHNHQHSPQQISFDIDKVMNHIEQIYDMNDILDTDDHTKSFTVFQDLTYFLKLAVDKVFNDNEIGNIIYNIINFGDFEDLDDVLDDILDRNNSYIIAITSETVNNNDSILYEWNYKDSNKLHGILIRVYEDHMIDINAFHKQSQSSDNPIKTDSVFQERVIVYILFYRKHK